MLQNYKQEYDEGVLVITSNQVMETLLWQIQAYLNQKITKEQFYDLAETFYTNNAELIKGTEFDHIYLSFVPDACLYYIDEPGLSEAENETRFKMAMEDAYRELSNL